MSPAVVGSTAQYFACPGAPPEAAIVTAIRMEGGRQVAHLWVADPWYAADRPQWKTRNDVVRCGPGDPNPAGAYWTPILS